jgi:methyl-accepting chemotaxis protein
MNGKESVLIKIVKSFQVIAMFMIVVFCISTRLIVKNWGTALMVTVVFAGILITTNLLMMLPIKRYIQKSSAEIERIKQGDFSFLLNIKEAASNKMFAKIIGAMGDIILEFKDLITHFFSLAETVVSSSKEVNAAVEHSLTAMQQIAATGQEIAAGASKQAEESQNCEELIESLSKEISDVYENYSSVMDQTTKITQLSDVGSHSLNILREKTDDTKQSKEKIALAVETLTNKIKDISIFVDSIESIASQTNLLALNAAIEAARAGDAGRGFGVVAEEIRKLADESRKSTEEIKNLVESIQEQSITAANAMTAMNKVSDEEANAVNNTHQAFEDIASGITYIVKKIDKTNGSVTKVNNHKEKVRGAVQHIAAVTQSTAAKTQEVASTIENQITSMEKMKKATEHLNEAVYKIDVQLVKYKR